MEGKAGNTPEEQARADAITRELEEAAKPSLITKLKEGIRKYGKGGEMPNPDMERYAKKVLRGIESHRSSITTKRDRELKRRRAAKRARKVTRMTARRNNGGG